MDSELAEKQRAYEEWAKTHVKKIFDRLLKLDLVSTEARWEVVWAVPHQVLIGKIWEDEWPSKAYWIIGGELPEDYIKLQVAETPREAAKHFAMKWQLDGARVAGLAPETAQATAGTVRWDKIGGSLGDKAEQLFAIVERDDLWQ